MSVSLCGTSGGGASSAISQWRQQLFQKLDANSDGSVDKSEFETGLQSKGVDSSKADELFAKLDQNGDGSVSQTELTQGMHKAHHHRRAQEAQGSSDASSASGSSSSSSLADLFSQIDSDGDGNVSQAEFQAFGQKLSSQMTGTLLAGQDIGGGGGFGFGPPPPPPGFGTQAYGQASAWGSNGSSGDQQQNAGGVLVQQMLSALSA